jgi:TPR repeat protein
MQLESASRYRQGTSGTKVDFAAAWQACSDAANLGSSDGMTCMGEMLKRGEGRPIDMHAAIQMFQNSAAKGNAAAQRNLAICYATGVCGLEEDQAKAVLHYYFASVGGDLQAQMALGYR